MWWLCQTVSVLVAYMVQAQPAYHDSLVNILNIVPVTASRPGHSPVTFAPLRFRYCGCSQTCARRISFYLGRSSLLPIVLYFIRCSSRPVHPLP